MNRQNFILCSLAIVLWIADNAQAQTVSAPTCALAITASEKAERLPPQVLGAIGLVESGRVNPHTGIATPWPWSINVAGTGHVFDSAADAIVAVQTAQAAGVQSIDVGCMQVNLLHHPHAFATLQDAFDPAKNVRYAAAFLTRLYNQTGSWGAAIAAYHSANPALGIPYARTVALMWPLAARFGLIVLDQTVSTRAALEAEIDPHKVLTQEFRTQLVDAELQHRRELVDQANVKIAAITNPALAWPLGALPVVGTLSRKWSSREPPDRVALENEVDPQRVLTPTFRAQMVAANRARRRRNAEEHTSDMSSGSGKISHHFGLLPVPRNETRRGEEN